VIICIAAGIVIVLLVVAATLSTKDINKTIERAAIASIFFIDEG